jgi:tRNA(Ile2)-agmatinylcytidine synthase
MGIIRIGLDDTDSRKGMCTTYIGAVIVRKLREKGIQVFDFPRLIRLNPNIPWKTRGNCAICILCESKPSAEEIALRTVEELAELEVESTNPGVVFYEGGEIPELEEFSRRTVQEVVTIEEAEQLAKKVGAEIHKFKLGRGIIGALAAIGHPLKDFTFELLAYRKPEFWGKPRRVDPSSVIEMDKKTFPRTFDNLDPSTGEIRITPHTPCPILYGIRGGSPEAVLEAHSMVRTLEPVDFYQIYKTNQATDEHLVRVQHLREIRPLLSVVAEGIVSHAPRILPGGHVIFSISDGTAEVDCAAYEPTRNFRFVASSLRVGDRVRVYGAAKQRTGLPLTVNLEKLEVLQLTPALKKLNPKCPRCGRRMKSEGKGKGYSCPRCGEKAGPSSQELVEVERKLSVGLYEVPPRARRHLSKPLVRMGRVY